jgi:molybdenum-dependent DNA-binding transcriptional regulator ModE
MKTTGLNFRHLYFFRVVAAEGSVTGAAERLGLAIQTVSTQIQALEQSIGKSLLTQQGRRLVPTEVGRVALTYAEEIFELGDRMQEALEDVDAGKMRLTVGISDSMPKLIAFRLLQATQRLDKQVKLVCMENEFDSLAKCICSARKRWRKNTAGISRKACTALPCCCRHGTTPCAGASMPGSCSTGCGRMWWGSSRITPC